MDGLTEVSTAGGSEGAQMGLSPEFFDVGLGEGLRRAEEQDYRGPPQTNAHVVRHESQSEVGNRTSPN